MTLVLVPWKQAKMSGASFAISTLLWQNPADASYGWVNSQIDILAWCIIDRDEGRWVDDSVLEGLHGLLVLLLPNKHHAFTCEVNKGVSDRWIIVDPNLHEAGGTKECLNVSEHFAGGPVPDACDLQIVGNVAFVVAFVAQNYNFWYCHEQFHGRDSGAGTVEAVEDAMEVE
jgi:hypothetical protein